MKLQNIRFEERDHLEEISYSRIKVHMSANGIIINNCRDYINKYILLWLIQYTQQINY